MINECSTFRGFFTEDIDRHLISTTYFGFKSKQQFFGDMRLKPQILDIILNILFKIDDTATVIPLVHCIHENEKKKRKREQCQKRVNTPSCSFPLSFCVFSLEEMFI